MIERCQPPQLLITPNRHESLQPVRPSAQQPAALAFTPSTPIFLAAGRLQPQTPLSPSFGRILIYKLCFFKYLAGGQKKYTVFNELHLSESDATSIWKMRLHLIGQSEMRYQ